jgi:hypothetical protein
LAWLQKFSLSGDTASTRELSENTVNGLVAEVLPRDAQVAASVMELDWRLFGLAVELQLDLDLDPLILTPAWRGLKLMELLARHSLYLIGREGGRYAVSAQ